MGLFSEDWGTLAVVLAGALAGGFANGLTGFGTGLTALPFWLQVVEPVIAAQLASACGVIGQVATLPTIWHAIDWRRLAPTLLAGLVGVPIGIFLLPYVSLGTFKLTV
ncbi:MAG: sulfite exporter TauE/SafE family protein, partial [Alphaproteobacteria bacterium]